MINIFKKTCDLAMNSLIRNFFFVVIVFVFNPFTVSASNGTLVLDPQNPGPYEGVTITFKTYDFNVDNAKFTWYVDKKVVLSGKGEKSLPIKTKGVGVNTMVDAKIEVPGGEIVNSAINLSPQAVGLVWESTESYVPPFYEGKALPSEDSAVRIIAVPSFSSQGAQINASDLSYAWYLNDNFINSGSGRGKSTLNTRLDFLSNENTYKVIVRSDGGSVAENRITISPNQISPVFYLKDPILGLDLAHAIEKRFETTKEFALSLVPYFVSSKNGLGSSVNYSWTLDGLLITPNSNTDVTLRPKDNSYGSKFLSVSIENTKRYLQKAQDDLNVVFDTRQ